MRTCARTWLTFGEPEGMRVRATPKVSAQTFRKCCALLRQAQQEAVRFVCKALFCKDLHVPTTKGAKGLQSEALSGSF